MHRRRVAALSEEHKAKISAKSRAQHAAKRGFDIPDDKIEQYKELRRRGVKDDRLWDLLGLPQPKWLTK